MHPPDLRDIYRRYIDACNRRRFDQLHTFVADDVIASETATGLGAYIAGIKDVVAGFADYRWDPHNLIVDNNWIAVRLTGTGTHTGTFRGIPATHRTVTIQELAIYRTEGGKIAHCWGDLGSVLRDAIVSGSAEPPIAPRRS